MEDGSQANGQWRSTADGRGRFNDLWLFLVVYVIFWLFWRFWLFFAIFDDGQYR